MWTGGHSVKVVSRSNSAVVVEETATKPVAWGFILFGLLALPLYRSILSAAIGACFVMFGIYASVASTFVADRDRRLLVVTRRLGRLEFTKRYEASDIEEVFVRFTRKGSGLALRFRSGRTKWLTMSLGASGNLDQAAAILTAYLFVPSRGHIGERRSATGNAASQAPPARRSGESRKLSRERE